MPHIHRASELLIDCRAVSMLVSMRERTPILRPHVQFYGGCYSCFINFHVVAIAECRVNPADSDFRSIFPFGLRGSGPSRTSILAGTM